MNTYYTVQHVQSGSVIYIKVNISINMSYSVTSIIALIIILLSRVLKNIKMSIEGDTYSSSLKSFDLYTQTVIW